MKKSTRFYLLGLLPLILGLVACGAAGSDPGEPTATAAPQLGEVILQESFADNANGWPVSKDENVEAAIADGKFMSTTFTKNHWSFFKPSLAASDIDLTMDTTFLEGDPGNAGYGVLCHVQDNKNLYGFTIAPDGKYMVYKTIADKPQTIMDWTSSDAIKPGTDAVNQMRVICAANRLVLIVNDVTLVDVTDDSLSGGTFALQAGSGDVDEKPVKMAFANLIIRKPTAESAATVSQLDETFDDNQNKWEVYEEDGGSVAIADGQLVMQLRKAELFWTKPGQEFTDVDLTFDGSVVEGTPASAGYGAMCRFQDSGNYYVFLVVGDGGYGLFKSVAGQLTEIVPLQPSEAIQPGGAVNKVHIVCSGEDLQLSVNDKSLILVKDGTFKDGAFLLVAQSFDKKGEQISVAYDNLVLKAPAE